MVSVLQITISMVSVLQITISMVSVLQITTINTESLVRPEDETIAYVM